MRGGTSRWVIGFLAPLAVAGAMAGGGVAAATAPALAPVKVVREPASVGRTVQQVVPAPVTSGTRPVRTGATAVSLPGQLVVGQVTVATGQAYVGDVDMVAGSLVVDGILRGGVTMTAGRVAVGSGGRITGPVQLGTGLVQVAPGGRIEGTVQVGTHSQPDLLCPAAASGGCSLTGGSGPTVVPPLPIVAGGGVVSPGGLRGLVLGGFLRRLFGLGPWAGALALGLRLLTWLGLLALALPVAAIWPAAVDGVRRQIERDPGRSALIGLLALVLALPVLLAISITIVGIPVAFAAALGMVAAWFFGYVAVVSLIGARTGALARGGEAPAPLWAIVLGSAILAAIGWVPLLGGLVTFAVACVAIGAVLLSRFGTDRPWLPPRRTPNPGPAVLLSQGPAEQGGTGGGGDGAPPA